MRSSSIFLILMLLFVAACAKEEKQVEKTLPPKAAAKVARWSATANLNNEKANMAIDGDTATTWYTGSRQAPGQWLKIDLGKESDISEVILKGNPTDYPRSLVVEVSADDRVYRKAKEIEDVPKGAETVIGFEKPVRARYIKMTQTGNDNVYWWTVGEFEIR